MAVSVKDRWALYRKRRGYEHEEEQSRTFRCTQTQFNNRDFCIPREDPKGECEYTETKKIMVPDDVPEHDIDRLLELDNRDAQDSILKEISNLKSEVRTLGVLQERSEGHLKIIKYCMIFFVVLTAISVILSIVSMSNLSKLLDLLH